MKKRTLKAIGFLMTLVMLFGLVTAYPTMSAEEPVLDAEQLLPDAVQEVTVPAEPSLPTEIPTELISDSKIAEAGHVRRLPQAEGDMNTVMLANEDGTHSMYLFSYPVKYTGENGNVYDKSNRLTAHSRSGYAYVNEENDIQTHLPTDITKNPVILTYGDYAVATYIGTESLRSTAQLQNENTVLYTGAFGTDTAVRYTADFSGYKEDVILYSASAPTSFTFLLRPAGLVPVAENGVIRYQDKDTGETVLTTSPFYIYDSAENPNSYIDTDFSLEELTGGIYVLTVTLDAEYLATEGLTYPIYVDPSVYYASTGDVETATVYSGEPDTTSTMYDYLGYRGSTYGEARMLVRLNALKNNVIFRSLTEAQVTSVTLNMCLAGGGNGEGLLLMYRFTGSDDWEPGTARWSDVSATSFAMPYAGAMISPESNTSGIYNLDITNIAECWLGLGNASTTTASQGLIMINNYATSSEYTRCFYSAQSFTGVLPTVTVTYTPTIQDGTYYIRNSATETYMKKGGTTEGSSVLTDSFDVDASKWTITLQSNGYYTIKTASQNLYLGIDANDTAGTSTVRLNNTTGRGSQWAILPMSNGNYALMAQPVASNSNGVITRVLGVTETDSEVGQYAKSNDENEKQYGEWELYTYHYTLNIEVMYEEAFANRYTSYLLKIRNSMNVVQERLLVEFGVRVVYDTPTLYSSLGDQCNSKMIEEYEASNITSARVSPCTHIEDDDQCMNSTSRVTRELHHKNIYNILYDVPKANEDVCVKVLFVGNEYCHADSTGCSPGGFAGLTSLDNNVAVISASTQNEKSYAKTVLHEIGHLYDDKNNTKDHYGSSKLNVLSTDDKNKAAGKEGLFSEACIYGENRNNEEVLEKMIICEGCRQMTLANISRFNHDNIGGEE